MGKVCDIECKPRRKTRRRKKPSKTALVLGGGGFTGGVYEIGALRALDLLAVNSTVNNFDVYVGTSAGSFVAAMLANGITPDEMMQVINTRAESEFEDLALRKMLSPNYVGCAKSLSRLPLRSAEAVRALLRVNELSAIDLGVAMAENLPTGLYNGSGIGDYVGEVLTDGGRSNDFRVIEPELYLTATDLDTTERIVFGEGGGRAGPVSKGGVGRGAVRDAGGGVHRVAARQQAGRAEGAAVGRRRDPLDHQRRHRGRGGGELHHRQQPPGPRRERLREDDPDDVRQSRAPRLRHGPAGDRQPDLPPDRPRPAPPGGRTVAGGLPRGGNRGSGAGGG